MKNNKTFCIQPFIRVIYNPYSEEDNQECFAIPCCDIVPGSVKETTNYPNIIKQSPAWNKLQNDFIQGNKPPECIKCWTLEDLGLRSQRIDMNNRYQDLINSKRFLEKKLKYIEIRFGNTCNLACRTCNSSASSRWKRLDEMFYAKGILQYPPKKSKYTDWRNIDFSEVETLNLMGGEPIFQQDALKLVKHLDSIGVINNIQLMITTNAVIFINDEWQELIKKTKHTSITVSIDAIGPLNDYIRHGSSWNTIEHNLKKYKMFSRENKNVTLGVNTVISVFNINFSKEIKQHFDNLSIYSFQSYTLYPEYISANCLPLTIRNAINDAKLSEESLKMIKSTPFDIEQFNLCKKSILLMDDYFNTSFEKVNPEMYRLIFNH